MVAKPPHPVRIVLEDDLYGVRFRTDSCRPASVRDDSGLHSLIDPVVDPPIGSASATDRNYHTEEQENLTRKREEQEQSNSYSDHPKHC
ncbi:MAG: hypothetical protein EOS11_17275 [Mesorhizobium sp.]|nr:MAG: hypothetical protein EOS11_17275 [Mesorhizobium sp.]